MRGFLLEAREYPAVLPQGKRAICINKVGGADTAPKKPAQIPCAFSAGSGLFIGKKFKPDVQQFSRNLMDNIIALHEDLQNKTYQHGGYESFYVNDPKRRHIHKANVRDRLLHHAVYRILYPSLTALLLLIHFRD